VTALTIIKCVCMCTPKLGTNKPLNVPRVISLCPSSSTFCVCLFVGVGVPPVWRQQHLCSTSTCLEPAGVA
jgi:hypothetical protein